MYCIVIITCIRYNQCVSTICHAMEEPCPIPPVAELSDSSGTNSEWLQKIEQKTSKRRRLSRLVKKRPLADDSVQIQLMLSRNGSTCKSGCRDCFRRTAGFQELLAFRKEWAQLHKLDQDNVAAREKEIVFNFAQGFSPIKPEGCFYEGDQEKGIMLFLRTGYPLIEVMLRIASELLSLASHCFLTTLMLRYFSGSRQF